MVNPDCSLNLWFSLRLCDQRRFNTTSQISTANRKPSVCFCVTFISFLYTETRGTTARSGLGACSSVRLALRIHTALQNQARKRGAVCYLPLKCGLVSGVPVTSVGGTGAEIISRCVLLHSALKCRLCCWFVLWFCRNLDWVQIHKRRTKKMRVNAWFQSEKLICEEFKSSIWIKFRLVRLTVHLALMIPKFGTCKHHWPVIRICFTLHKVELR